MDDSTQLRFIAHKLRTYAAIYTGDKEARAMAEWCDRRASEIELNGVLAENGERFVAAMSGS